MNNSSTGSNNYETKIEDLNEQIKKLKQQLENEINKNKALTIQIKELDISYKKVLKENENLIETNKRLNLELSTIKKIEGNKGNNNLNYEDIISLYKKK